MGTYSYKPKPKSGFLIHLPTTQPRISVEHFKLLQLMKSRVSPSSYNVMPNMLKVKQNTTNTFEKAVRRFKFNDKVEVVDRLVSRDQLSESAFDWRKINLTGMQGKPSPGPGEYSYPSEFGQYISEKAKFAYSTQSTKSRSDSIK